jgi:hypothetical protein
MIHSLRMKTESYRLRMDPADYAALKVLAARAGLRPMRMLARLLNASHTFKREADLIRNERNSGAKSRKETNGHRNRSS